MTIRRLRVGCKGNKLAIQQTHTVLNLLLEFFPNLIFEIKYVKTIRNELLDYFEIGSNTYFIYEIFNSLLNDKIDIAVLSFKEIPLDLPDGLIIGAVLPRNNPEQVLISKNNISFVKLPLGSKLGTNSLSTKAQILAYRPDLVIVPTCGDLNEKIQTLYNSDLNAIIEARAEVEQMKLQHLITEIFSTEAIIPVVGQAAIGIILHNNNTFAQEILEGLNDIETEYAIRAERSFLRSIEEECRKFAAAHAFIVDYEIFIQGMVSSRDGNQIVKHSVFGLAIEPEKTGTKLAQQIHSIETECNLKDNLIFESNRK